jgi:hypothetical protein
MTGWRAGLTLLGGTAALMLLTACGVLGPDYPKTTPPAARFAVGNPLFAGLTTAQRARLEQYLAQTPRWVIQSEGGKTFAIRLEVSNGEPGEPPAGQFRIPSNGFFSDFSAPNITQTRVLVGLGSEYGFGHERGQITRAAAGPGETQLVLEKYMDQPGLQSYLIVQGGSDVTLEIFEQARDESRVFTRQALRECYDEFARAVRE